MNQNLRRILLAWLSAVLLISSVGCSSEEVGPSSGIVRFDDGSPVQSGSIEFRRLRDKERFSSRIAPNGGFTPVDGDGTVGLPPGNYDIVVVQIVLTEDLALHEHTHGGTVPRRYADYHTSDLTFEVVKGRTSPIEVRVESEEIPASDES